MDNGNFILALTLTLVAGLSTGIGGAIIIFTKKLSNKFLAASQGIQAYITHSTALSWPKGLVKRVGI